MRDKLREKIRQTRTLQRQLTTERTWLKATVSRAGPFLQLSPSRLSMAVEVTVENIGRSVALNVNTSVALFVFSERVSAHVNIEVQGFLQRARWGDSVSTDVQPMLFPSERGVAQSIIGLSWHEVHEAEFVSPHDDNRLAAQFFIVGYAAYRLANLNSRHVSTFGYFIHRDYIDHSTGTRHQFAPFPVEGLPQVPVNEFSLSPTSHRFEVD